METKNNQARFFHVKEDHMDADFVIKRVAGINYYNLSSPLRAWARFKPTDENPEKWDAAEVKELTPEEVSLLLFTKC